MMATIFLKGQSDVKGLAPVAFTQSIRLFIFVLSVTYTYKSIGRIHPDVSTRDERRSHFPPLRRRVFAHHHPAALPRLQTSFRVHKWYMTSGLRACFHEAAAQACSSIHRSVLGQGARERLFARVGCRPKRQKARQRIKPSF